VPTGTVFTGMGAVMDKVTGVTRVTP